MLSARLTGLLTAVLALPGLARGVSFSEARQAAARASPEVVLAAHRSAVANAEVSAAGALANPTVSVSTARLTARLGASLSVPVPVFGQRATAITAAQADADATALDEAVVAGQARWAVTLAWVDLWEAQERARLLQSAADDASRLASVALERFEAGSAPKLDKARTRAEQARAVAEARGAQLTVGAAAARLAPLIDVPFDETLAAAGEPGFSDGAAAQSSADPALHPALRRDRSQQEAAAAHLRHEERQRWPTLSPQVTVNAFDPSLQGADVIVGLGFELPVLSLRGGQIARAQSVARLTEATTRAEGRRLQALVLDAGRRREAASAALRALRSEVLPAMEEVKAMTAEGYDLGRVDLVRVLDAQRALLESRLAEAEARAALTRATADLELALGVSLEGAAQ